MGRKPLCPADRYIRTIEEDVTSVKKVLTGANSTPNALRVIHSSRFAPYFQGATQKQKQELARVLNDEVEHLRSGKIYMATRQVNPKGRPRVHFDSAFASQCIPHIKTISTPGLRRWVWGDKDNKELLRFLRAVADSGGVKLNLGIQKLRTVK